MGGESGSDTMNILLEEYKKYTNTDAEIQTYAIKSTMTGDRVNEGALAPVGLFDEEEWRLQSPSPVPIPFL